MGPWLLLMRIQLLHTSASLAINKNWDPDVRDDRELMLNRIMPEDAQFRHSCEGPDDVVSIAVQICFYCVSAKKGQKEKGAGNYTHERHVLNLRGQSSESMSMATHTHRSKYDYILLLKFSEFESSIPG